MSTSDLYILNHKSTTWVAEFRNGWGSGPCIWDHLASKYLPHVNFTDYNRTDYVGFERKNRMVWDMAEESSPITPEERAVLMMTFDRSYIPKAHLKAAGEACAAAYGMIQEHGSWKGVNHWQAIGDTLIQLSNKTLHRQSRGVVLNCTSVNDVWIHPSPEYLEKAWPIYSPHQETANEAQ